MLCQDAKRVVYFFLDGSLGEKTKSEFHNHVTICPDCESRTTLHKRLRSFIQGRFSRLSTVAPERFKLRLTRSIRAFRTEWSR
jgi:hypothetical protein